MGPEQKHESVGGDSEDPVCLPSHLSVSDSFVRRVTCTDAMLRVSASCMKATIADLERERLQLLRKLHDTTMQVSGRGFTFAGPDAYQTEKLRSIATSLGLGSSPRLLVRGSGPRDQDMRQVMEGLIAGREKDARRILHLERALQAAKSELHPQPQPMIASIITKSKTSNMHAQAPHRSSTMEPTVPADALQVTVEGMRREVTSLSLLLRSSVRELLLRKDLRTDWDRPVNQSTLNHVLQPDSISELLKDCERSGCKISCQLNKALQDVAVLRLQLNPGCPSVRLSVNPVDHWKLNPCDLPSPSHHWFELLSNASTSCQTEHLTSDRHHHAAKVQPAYADQSAPAWTLEVQVLHAMLAKTLMLLDERERECVTQERLLKMFCGQSSRLRQVLASWYLYHLRNFSKWECQGHTVNLESPRMASVSRTTDENGEEDPGQGTSRKSSKTNYADVAGSSAPGAWTASLRRRAAVAEDECGHPVALCTHAEPAVSTTESTMRTRILYLEMWKHSASLRMEALQAELDASVPVGLVMACSTELEAVRNQSLKQSCEIATLQSELTKLHDVPRQVAHARQIADVAVLCRNLSEKKCRRVHDDLLVLRNFANCRAERTTGTIHWCDEYQLHNSQASNQVTHLVIENRSLREILACMSAREAGIQYKQSRQHVHIEANTTGFLPFSVLSSTAPAEYRLAECGRMVALRSKLRDATLKLEAMSFEIRRLRDVAQTAATQSATALELRHDAEEHCRFLTNQVRRLELRSGDDHLIGKLQRELMSTQRTYRVLARKHASLEAELTHQQASQLVTETQTDAQSEAFASLREEHRWQLAVLHGALASTLHSVWPVGSESIFWDSCTQCASTGARTAMSIGGCSVGTSDVTTGMVRLAEGWLSISCLQHERHMLGALLKAITDVSGATERRAIELRSSDQVRHHLQTRIQRLQLEFGKLRQQVHAVRSCPNEMVVQAAQGQQGCSPTQMLALLDEVKLLKLRALRDYHEIATLHDAKRSVETALATTTDYLAASERARLDADSRGLLFRATASHASAIPLLQDRRHFVRHILMNNDIVAKSSSVLRTAADSAVRIECSGVRVDPTAVNVYKSVDLVGVHASKAMAQLATDLQRLRSELRYAHAATDEAVIHVLALAEGVSYYEQVLHEGCRYDDGSMKRGVSMDCPVGGLLEARLYAERKLHCGNWEDNAFIKTKTPVLLKASQLSGGQQLPLKSRHRGDSLKHVATTTISSLQALVAEKNHELAQAQTKLARARSGARHNAQAECARIGHLADKLHHEHNIVTTRLRGVLQAVETKARTNTLEDAAPLLRGLRGMLTDTQMLHEENWALEEKLRTANSARVLAETRYTKVVREVSSQRSDLIALAVRVSRLEKQHADTASLPYLRSLWGGARSLGVGEVQGNLSRREHEFQALREALMKLKADFVRSQEHAQVTDDSSKRVVVAENTFPLSRIRTYGKHQINTLHADARASRRDTANAHVKRVEYRQKLRLMSEEISILASTAKAAEARANELDCVLTWLRNECQHKSKSRNNLT
mmetsp:Transcript_24982/g.99254  ORF Transcript_24982/g.99254 Transcript_24982/m.99254 type:complete len:1541 (-) Transcript_24982:988-5610(-)